MKLHSGLFVAVAGAYERKWFALEFVGGVLYALKSVL